MGICEEAKRLDAEAYRLLQDIKAMYWDAAGSRRMPGEHDPYKRAIDATYAEYMAVLDELTQVEELCQRMQRCSSGGLPGENGALPMRGNSSPMPHNTAPKGGCKMRHGLKKLLAFVFNVRGTTPR